MSIEAAVTVLLFVMGTAYSYRRGGAPEQCAAAIIVIWLALSVIYRLIAGPASFISVDPARFALDMGELIAISFVAVRANRMWPLWAAAAQLICVMGHVAAFIEPGGMRRAYWAMTQIPPFIQLCALLLGAIAHTARLGRIGPYRSWRYR